MLAAPAQPGGMGAMADGGVPQPGGTNSGGTNSGGGINMPMVKYTTNDLWLEMLWGTIGRDELAIHPLRYEQRRV